MTAEAVGAMTHAEGLAAVNTALCYVKLQGETTPTETMLLRRWHGSAAKKRGYILKQKTLDNLIKT